MRIDIMVPNFDNSSEDVTISKWYKKIGDKISKNEVIAEAETALVACGITSSYNCVLAEILVKEGGMINQGSKIAVIETESESDNIIKEESMREEARHALEAIEEQIIEDKIQQDEQLEEIIEHKEESEILHTSTVIENEIIEEFHAPTNHHHEKPHHMSDEEDITLQKENIAQEKFMNILRTAEENAKQDAIAIKEQIIEEARQQAILDAAELKAKIIKEYEEKAVHDAGEMHKKIINGSIQEAENTKAKLLEEAKQQAMKAATEIKNEITHRAEIEAKAAAENTMCSAIKEAQEQAKMQAEEFSKQIIEAAIKESKLEAKAIKKDIINSANKFAQKETKNILKDALKQAEIVKKLLHVEEAEKAILEQELEHKSNLSEDLLESEDLNIRSIQKTQEKSICEKLLDGISVESWKKPTYFASPDDANEKIDFLRMRISEKMRESYDTSVISTVSNEVDMSAVLSLEKTFGHLFTAKHNTRLGFTPFFISACLGALKQYKIFNAHVRKGEIIYKSNYDISIITCGNDGLAAPVIRNADKLSIADLERSMIALSKRAVEGILSIEEVSGGTFTVVNAGIYGSLMGTDLLTPPQVATLSVHKMHNRPIATENGIEVKPMLYISLSYDHRVSDTKSAAEFLSLIKNYVENPGWQILGL